MRTCVIRTLVSLLRCGILSLCVLALCCSAAFSEPGRESAPFRVQVRVDGDQGLRSQVTGCLTRSLGEINDVLVTDDRPDYKLRIIAMAVVTQSRKSVGLSISVLITSPYAGRVESLAEAYVPEESRPQVRTILSGAEEIVSHWIQTGAPAEIPKICQSIVSSFDHETLSKARAQRRASILPEGPRSDQGPGKQAGVCGDATGTAVVVSRPSTTDTGPEYNRFHPCRSSVAIRGRSNGSHA
jgi:hypothetical protein